MRSPVLELLPGGVDTAGGTPGDMAGEGGGGARFFWGPFPGPPVAKIAGTRSSTGGKGGNGLCGSV